ncbi:bifunctional adenosylcobinamide kinase/adenosylcobinamide-phosphate guanylyltransferase [Anaerobacillus sp. HL2]|nr:bifunctional adenosylcobinamide kinase/adenosylcobinamide-phosphate guanylyltransferase [Anaerobacillus sp. HL2]
MIFISGGVRSGKSSFAENLAYSYITEKRNKLIYIATSKNEDSEMAGRIKKHQQDRKKVVTVGKHGSVKHT